MFYVEWLESALDELTRLWTQADSATRRTLTAASHEIDTRLESDPETESESRPFGRRITFVSPLAVIFRVEADGETVTVVSIRMFRTRSK